mmetsp:Transcript_61077/g.149529  ORF Transcript_61077/g.149529 Transcript_61077/m.149529 type:complete len:584 (+) Transcript_61077:244-1995(+)
MDNNNGNNNSPRLRQQRRRRAQVGGGSAAAAARCCCAVVTTVAAIAIAATQTITTTSGFISSSSIRTSPSSSSLLLRRAAPVPVTKSIDTINALVSTTKQKQRSRLFAGSVATSSNPSLLSSSSPSSSSSETTDEEQQQQEQEECPVGSESLCMDRQEFEMQVGRAMDTLRSDYPDLLTHNPDYSIYDPMVELVDPSGVRLHGMKNYKNVYRLLHAIVNIFYCPERSGLTFRMCFDKARQNIRIHWNAQVIPREIFGGYKTTLHADGISIYEFDRRSGNITQHRLERLVINDAPVTPEQGIFAALRGHAIKSEVDGIPVFNFEPGTTTISGTNSASNNNNNNNQAPFDGVLQFQSFKKINSINNNHRNMKNLLMMTSSSGSVLFGDSPDDENQQKQQQQSAPAANAEEDSNVVMYSSSDVGTATPPSTASSSSTINIDVEELDTKNAARKKFGLKPLTPEEFLQLEEQVAEIDEQQRKKKAANAAAAELAAEQERKKSQGNVFTNFLGNALQDTCETNFDCEWPEVCCDFGFKKSCCSSGMRIFDGPPQSRQGQLAEVPIPQGNDEFPPNMDPRNPGGGGRYY